MITLFLVRHTTSFLIRREGTCKLQKPQWLFWNFSATIPQLAISEKRIVENADRLRILYYSGMGRAGFEPAKAYSQQIYSLPRLAASVPTRTVTSLAFGVSGFESSNSDLATQLPLLEARYIGPS